MIKPAIELIESFVLTRLPDSGTSVSFPSSIVFVWDSTCAQFIIKSSSSKLAIVLNFILVQFNIASAELFRLIAHFNYKSEKIIVIVFFAKLQGIFNYDR